MQRSVVQQGFAVGFAGLVGVMTVPGSANGGAAPPEPEGAADAALLEPLAGQATMLAQAAEEEAGLLSLIDEASPMEGGIYPKYECMQEPYKCPDTRRCVFPSGSSICHVTNCGEGKCPTCPDVVSKIVIKGWCSYGCMRGTEVIGGALVFRPRIGNDDLSNATPFCIDKEGKVYRDGKVIL